MSDEQRSSGSGAGARVTAIAASVMDLHVRIALQEVELLKILIWMMNGMKLNLNSNIFYHY